MVRLLVDEEGCVEGSEHGVARRYMGPSRLHVDDGGVNTDRHSAGQK